MIYMKYDINFFNQLILLTQQIPTLFHVRPTLQKIILRIYYYYQNTMGINLTKITSWFSKREIKVLMTGLENAGKTTLLYKMKPGQVAFISSLIGSIIQTATLANIKFYVWDINYRFRTRQFFWNQDYYRNSQALIFIIDASDRQRIQLAKQKFQKVISEEQFINIPILILANKKDLTTMTVPQLIEKLDLNRLNDRKWHIEATSALTGDGIKQSLNWIKEVTSQNK